MSDPRKVVRLKDLNAIEAEAAAWVARLDSDDATEADFAAFTAWKAEHAQHEEAADRLGRLWSEMDLLGSLASPLPLAAQNKPARVVGWAMAAAAVLAIAIGVGLYAPTMLGGKTEVYETAIGKHRTVNFADGSSVEMNTNSQLEVRYSGQARDFRLKRGEAFFDVAPDKTRPFSVYTTDGVVRAVGTGFAVRVGQNRLEVTVSKGVVQVSSLTQSANSVRVEDMRRLPRKTLAMVAAEKAGGGRVVLTGGHFEQVDVPAAQLAREQSWRQGMLVFQGEELSEAIADVSRYTDIKIEIADPAIRSLKIGGYFRVGDVEPMLEALETGFKIRVERLDATHVRLSAAS